MSVKDCILSAQSQGHISPEEAKRLTDLYDHFLGAFRQTMGDGEAAAQAKAMLAERLDKEGLQRQRAALLQLDKAEEIKTRLLSNANARGEADPAQALTYLIEYFGELEGGGGSSVVGRQRALTGLAHAQMEEVLNEFRRGYSGRRLNKAKLDNVVREAFGEDTGDASAKALARAWIATADDLRQRYNQYGGMIGQLENWGLPQRHDGRAIRKAGFQQWRADILSAESGLDTARMRDHLTGQLLTPEQLEESLRHVFDSITTEGWAHRDPGMAAGGKGALFKQHAESRFLVFKNADAWLAYQKKYGEGDPFAAMMAHVNVMARDIGVMQVLGPNPESMLTYAKQLVLKNAHAARMGDPAEFVKKTEWLGRPVKDPVEYAKASIHRAEQMWNYVRGSTNTPVSTAMADTVATARNVVSAAALGSAVLSAPSDLAFQKTARQFAGLPVNGMLGEIVRNFSTASQREMTRTGLILDSAAHTLGENARYAGLQTGKAWSVVLQDRVMAGQGLSAWTQAGKQAFGLIFQGVLADHAHVLYEALPGAVARTLRRYGIDAGMWDVIRMTPLHELQAGSGATILRPADVRALDPQQVLQAYARRAEVVPPPRGLSMAQRARFLEHNVRLLTNSLVDTQHEVVQLRQTVADLPFMVRNGDEARRLRGLEASIPRYEAKIKELTAEAAQLRADAARLDASPQTPAGRLDLFPGLAGDPAESVARDIARNAAERYLEMILAETEYAVPTGTVRSRTMMIGDNQPGTGTGELLRSAAQFKSFGASVWQMQVGRMARETAGNGIAAGAAYATSLLFYTTMLGALSAQLKSLVKGQDPRDMKDPKFWGAALLQGGGLGIYGDFFFSDVNRMGGSFPATLAGPLIGRLDNVWKLTAGNVIQYAQGEKTNFGRELTRFVRDTMPGSSLWFARLAWERLAMDRLQRMVDPEAYEAFRRRRSQIIKDQRTDYWWSPGAASPERGIDWSNAVAGRR